MENVKTFMNVAFVVLCLVMLWYLFTYDTGRVRQTSEVPRRTTQQPYDQNYEKDYSDYYDNDYLGSQGSQGSSVVREEPRTIPQTESRESSGGFFDRFRVKDTERTSNVPAPENNYQQRQEDYYDRGRDYEYAGENPFGRGQTAPPPAPAPTRKVEPQQPARYTNSAYYKSERYTRDGKLGTYSGPMQNGVPHGFGIFEYDNGDKYIGEYRYGKRFGFGNSIFKKQGKIQVRQYEDNRKVSQRDIKGVSYGSMSFVHGGTKGTYYGPLYQKQPHGFGYFKMANGDLYIGSYQYGNRNGAGNMIYSDGTIVFRKYDNGNMIQEAKTFN